MDDRLHPRLSNEMHWMIGKFRKNIQHRVCVCDYCIHREAREAQKNYKPAPLMLTGNNAYIPDPAGETVVRNEFDPPPKFY